MMFIMHIGEKQSLQGTKFYNTWNSFFSKETCLMLDWHSSFLPSTYQDSYFSFQPISKTLFTHSTNIQCLIYCFLFLHFYVYVCGAECMYMHHMPAGACKGQKKVLDLLDLELQAVAGCHVGPGNQIWLFCNRRKHS